MLAALPIGAAQAVAQDAPRGEAGLWPPVLGAGDAFAADGRSGLALRGFDPVSYFLEGGPRPGDERFELFWRGVAWRFASDANREAFRHAPEAYAPRVGGYDAAAASRGHLVAADPLTFALIGTRLYLFRDDSTRRPFLADPDLAAEAEVRWPELKRQLLVP